MHFFGSRIIDTCGRKVPKSMDVFLPKILRRDFYTNLKNIPVTVNADKSIAINEYYDDVIAHVKEAFLIKKNMWAVLVLILCALMLLQNHLVFI